MIITNKLKLDLQKPGTTPTIHAVQNDSYSRNLEIALYADHKPFAFPKDGTVVIRYKKSDGKGGEYDTLPDGNAAWWLEQNILTVALAPQVLTTPGSVHLTVTLIADGTQLSISPIWISVEPVAAAKLAKSEDYFYITGLLPAPVSGTVGQYLRIAAVNDEGRITIVDASNGVAPQKGIDYWTESDQEAIVQDVLAALGTPVFGTVDGENNIILTGQLADGTYTLKYEFSDGNTATIGTLEYQAEPEETPDTPDIPDIPDTPEVVNLIPLSTDFDGSIFNNTGWMGNMRLNSKGQVAELGGNGYTSVTGFIPIAEGDVLRTSTNILNVPGSNQQGISFYDASKTFIVRITYNLTLDYFAYNDIKTNLITVNYDDMSFVYTHNPSLESQVANAAFVRFCLGGIDENTIITKNQEIPA